MQLTVEFLEFMLAWKLLHARANISRLSIYIIANRMYFGDFSARFYLVGPLVV